MHQRRVGCDAIEPGSELRVAAKRRQMPVHLKESVLQYVGRLGIAREPAGESEHTGLIPLHNRFEGGVVPGRGARGERFVARLGSGDLHDHSVGRLVIAAFTFAASSGVTSVMPWVCAACAATISKSSSSVWAVASNGQSGTRAAQAMYLSVLVPGAGIFVLLVSACLPLRCRRPRVVTSALVVACVADATDGVHVHWPAAADAAVGNAPVARTLRFRVDYELTRCPSVTRLKTLDLSRCNSNAMTQVDAMNRDERVPASSLTESLPVALAHAAAVQYT